MTYCTKKFCPFSSPSAVSSQVKKTQTPVFFPSLPVFHQLSLYHFRYSPSLCLVSSLQTHLTSPALKPVQLTTPLSVCCLFWGTHRPYCWSYRVASRLLKITLCAFFLLCFRYFLPISVSALCFFMTFVLYSSVWSYSSLAPLSF